MYSLFVDVTLNTLLRSIKLKRNVLITTITGIYAMPACAKEFIDKLSNFHDIAPNFTYTQKA